MPDRVRPYYGRESPTGWYVVTGPDVVPRFLGHRRYRGERPPSPASALRRSFSRRMLTHFSARIRTVAGSPALPSVRCQINEQQPAGGLRLATWKMDNRRHLAT